MAPGLTQTIRAGDELVMQDKDGHEFSVAARESDEVMEFIKAFDKWFHAKSQGVKGVPLEAMWYEVEQAYKNLPLRIQHELPSWVSIGASVRGHGHD